MQITGTLSECELELVKLAALGMRNRHIGWRMGIAEDTVKHWFVEIFDKTGAWSRLELVMRWVGEQGQAHGDDSSRAGFQPSCQPTPLPRPKSPASSSQRP